MMSDAQILAQLTGRFPQLAVTPAWQWHVARNGGFITDLVWANGVAHGTTKDGVKVLITDAGVKESS